MPALLLRPNCCVKLAASEIRVPWQTMNHASPSATMMTCENRLGRASWMPLSGSTAVRAPDETRLCIQETHEQAHLVPFKRGSVGGRSDREVAYLGGTLGTGDTGTVLFEATSDPSLDAGYAGAGGVSIPTAPV
ncbi:hypothetical protein RRF57_007141 [Xylaria bambusicola]|uniref:Uncharacterized protein n=1 Tax=Xylaria bambusicola TaxID=326684 RepID=A0AAN7Z626_9PEZI